MSLGLRALIVFGYGMLTALATGLGAVPFAFVKTISSEVVAAASAIAAGLMLGASFGLVAEGAAFGEWQTVAGATAGVVFIVLSQRLLGEHDVEFEKVTGADAREMLLIILVMTVHSFAEGAAVGVSFGGGDSLGAVITAAIAVHNIPEGLAITAVLLPRGVSLTRCALWSVFTSLPQPLMAVPSFLFVEAVRPALPYGLGFAAGAMVFMVLDELLPEAFEEGKRPTVAVIVSSTLVGMVLFQQYL